MLAVAYVLRLETLAREVDALNVAAGVAMAMGANVDTVSWESAKAGFDEELAAAPVASEDRPTTAKSIKMRAIGIG